MGCCDGVVWGGGVGFVWGVVMGRFASVALGCVHDGVVSCFV